MKINRTQDVHSVPQWVVANTHIEAIEKNAKLIEAGIDRLNVTAASEVSELCLLQECEQIEKCASSDQPYYYNSTWSDSHVQHLKEYASVCGLESKKVVGIDPTPVIEKKASSQEFVKTANFEASPMESALKDALGDPFHIEERSETSYMDKANWESITPELKLKDVPVTAMTGGIVPVRGGEDYRISNQQSLASHQNSIVDPEALDRFVESETRTAGEQLVIDNAKRKQEREEKVQGWQQEKIAEMEAAGFEAQGVVFPTEVGNVGSGISGSFMGAYSDADLQNLPERTAGESLSEQNDSRRASIQREAASDKDKRGEWDRIQESPSRMVSDHFSEELKKRLG